MRFVLTTFVVCLMFNLSFSQNQDVCDVPRYVTDIRSVAENVKEMSVNLLFQITEDSELDTFKINIPNAEKVDVTSNSIKIYDGNGKLIFKEKHRKMSMPEFNSFSPKQFAARYANRVKPLSIEWDYRLVVYSPKGEFTWPSISGVYGQIGDVSLRLNFDSIEDFEYSTNIQVDKEKDFSNGNYYYLWNIKKLTSTSGEFNGENVQSPYVRINFK